MNDSNNVRKAAVLLMSLPEDQAALVMSKLSDSQIEAVSVEIATMGNVQKTELETVINEFADSSSGSMGSQQGSPELAKMLVSKALGENASTALDMISQTVESVPFAFLKKIDPQNIQTFIVDEHPQTIALILSHLPPHFGAEIIGNLPDDKQLAVVRRVANMGQTSPEVIAEVERGLEHRMASVMNQSFDTAGGIGNVAEILNVTDRATERALLENLAQEDPELVEEIRRLMFVFEDITKLDDRSIQAILKNVDNAQWGLALKGASEALKERVLGNMSQRAAQMLVEEMEFLGSVKVSEVENVQQQVVDIVRRLEDSGEITTGAGDETEEFVS